MSDTKSLNEAVRGIRKQKRLVKKSLAGIGREFDVAPKPETKALTKEETGLSVAFKEAEKPKMELLDALEEEEKPTKRKLRKPKGEQAKEEPKPVRRKVREPKAETTFRIPRNTMVMNL